MQTRTGLVIHPYTAQYTDPVEIRAGDALILGRQDDEWPGWIWCTSPSGKSGWVPEQYIIAAGASGYARRDYTARELTVTPGDRLAIAREVNGWYWATAANGETGWVPVKNVKVEE